MISPLKTKWKDIKEYLKHVRGKPELHAPFRAHAKKLLAHCDTHPAGSVEALRTARPHALETVEEEVRTGRRYLKRRTFVRVDVYNEMYKDNPDYAGFFGELESNVDIAKSLPLMSGYWARGEINSWADGHYTVEDYDDASASHKKTIESGKLVLDKHQASDKFSAIAEVHQERVSAVESKFKKLSAGDMLKLLQRMQPGSTSQQSAPQLSTPEGDEKDEKNDEEDQENEEVDNESDSQGDDNLAPVESFLRARPKASASKASAATPPTKSSGTGGSSQRALIAASPTGRERAPTAGPRVTTGQNLVVDMVTDGRFIRLRDGVREDIASVQPDVDTLCDCKGLVDAEHPLGQGAAFQQHVKALQKRAQDHYGKCKAIERRILGSRRPSQLDPENEQVMAMIARIDACRLLLKVSATKNAPFADILSAFSKAREAGINTHSSKTYAAIEWSTVFEQHMQFDSVTDACAVLSDIHTPPGKYFSDAAGAERAVEMKDFIAGEFMTRQALSLKPADMDAPLKASPARAMLAEFIGEWSCVVDGSGQVDLLDLGAVVDCLDLYKTHDALERFEDCKQSDTYDNLSTLVGTVVQHSAGDMLIAHARGLVDKNAPKLRQATYEAKLRGLIEAVGAFMADSGEADRSDEAGKALHDRIAGFVADAVIDFGMKGSSMIDDWKQKVRDAALTAAISTCRERATSAYESAKLWLEGSREVRISWGEGVAEKAMLLEEFTSKAAIEKEEAAYVHSVHLCSFVATGLRASKDAPAVAVPSVDWSDTSIFVGYDLSFLEEAEVLLHGQAPEHWSAESGAWKDWYGPLKKKLQLRDMSSVKKVCDALEKLASPQVDDNVADIAQRAKSLVAQCRAPVRPTLETLVGLVSGPQQLAAAGGAGKRTLTKVMAELQEHKSAIEEEISAWTEDLNGATSVLQQEGVAKAALEKFVAHAGKAIDAASTASANEPVRVLQAAFDEADKYVAAIPDPTMDETAFTSYMKKHGSKLNGLSGQVDKSLTKLRDFAKASGKDIAADLANSAEELTSAVFNMISLHTLVTLLRNPQIKSANAQEERKWLKSTYEMFADPDSTLRCMPDYLREAEQILKIETPRAARVEPMGASDPNAAQGAHPSGSEAPAPASAGASKPKRGRPTKGPASKSVPKAPAKKMKL